jgi:hypothetical protein
MVSHQHEVPLELIRDDPSLILGFLSSLGVKAPEFSEIRLDAAELNELKVTEHHADLVALFYNYGKAVFAVVLEVQLRAEPTKAYDWLPYVANLWARRRCPTVLLVFVPSESVGRCCGRPIEIGHPGLILTPLIVGPDVIPVITDAVEAREAPEQTVLSALTHGDGPQGRAVLIALMEALDIMESGKAASYYEYVVSLLSEAARRQLESLMTATYERHSKFAIKHYALGKIAGRIEDILLILNARGVEVPADVRAEIARCDDLEQLDTWLIRAASASDVSELFEK